MHSTTEGLTTCTVPNPLVYQILELLDDPLVLSTYRSDVVEGQRQC